jgi:hypothetical protein
VTCVVRFNTLNQLANTSQLLLINRRNQLGVLAQLLFKEAQKNQHYWVAIVLFWLPASGAAGRKQNLAVGQNSGFNSAVKFGVRLEKSRIYAYALGISYRGHFSAVLLRPGTGWVSHDDILHVITKVITL